MPTTPTPQHFTQLFLVMVALSLGLKLWLASRQIRHVSAKRGAVPSEFAGRVSLEAHQKAADYCVARSRFGIAGTLTDMVLLLALTLGGGLQLLHDTWAAHLDDSLNAYSYGIAMIFSIMAISSLIDLPFSLYRQFVIEEKFGFNRMSFGLFCSDLLKNAVIGAAIGTPVILTVLWMMAKLGANWWLDVWLFWSAFNLLVMFVYPTWIAPLFNKFSPLPEGELKSRIEALLNRCGFASGGLFVMDGSKRSAHGNAYFTGFGKSKRIVFFDTLLERLTPPEIEAVLAHELGHFKHRHVLKRIVTMFALSLLFLWLLGQLIAAPWFYTGLGVHAENATLALVLFFLALPVFTFPFTPVNSYLSRCHEFEADAYATAHADADELARALVKLYEENASTLTPDPLHSLFYDSHPPATIRLAHLSRRKVATHAA